MEATTFRTKTGYCHLLNDQIVFSKQEQIGDFSELKSENRTTQNLIIYLILIGLCAYWGFRAYEQHLMVRFTILCCIGGIFLLSIPRILTYSDTAIILRNRITGVQFRKAVPFVNYAQFVVFFTDEKGRKRKRLILLPGKLNDQAETQQAVEKMERTGYISATV